MINIDELEKDNSLSDDEYIVYHPKKPTYIFNSLLDSNEDCEINISVKCELIKVISELDKYMKWLANCENELIDYMQNIIDEKIPENWIDNIEVFNIYITFVGYNDFGATIIFGESLFPDHSIEINFEKYNIVEANLNG